MKKKQNSDSTSKDYEEDGYNLLPSEILTGESAAFKNGLEIAADICDQGHFPQHGSPEAIRALGDAASAIRDLATKVKTQAPVATTQTAEVARLEAENAHLKRELDKADKRYYTLLDEKDLGKPRVGVAMTGEFEGRCGKCGFWSSTEDCPCVSSSVKEAE